MRTAETPTTEREQGSEKMNGTEAVVLLFFMGVFAVTAKIAHEVKKGDIVMVKPTLSAIAEGFGLKMKRKSDTEGTQRNAHPMYWMQIVRAHGFEKALRGVVNTLKNGGQLVARIELGYERRSLSGYKVVGWEDHTLYSVLNKGFDDVLGIPWKIGNKLEQIKSSLECGCHQNPIGSAPSCTEVLEMTINWMVTEHHAENVYLDRLASDAEIELDAEDERRWPYESAHTR